MEVKFEHPLGALEATTNIHVFGGVFQFTGFLPPVAVFLPPCRLLLLSARHSEERGELVSGPDMCK